MCSLNYFFNRHTFSAAEVAISVEREKFRTNKNFLRKTVNKMKLPKITNEDPLKNLKIKMHQSKVELIDAYCKQYKKTYNEDLEIGQFLEHVAENFISADKQFLKFVK